MADENTLTQERPTLEAVAQMTGEQATEAIEGLQRDSEFTNALYAGEWHQGHGDAKALWNHRV